MTRLVTRAQHRAAREASSSPVRAAARRAQTVSSARYCQSRVFGMFEKSLSLRLRPAIQPLQTPVSSCITKELPFSKTELLCVVTVFYCVCSPDLRSEARDLRSELRARD
jgi:hypothetical protein